MDEKRTEGKTLGKPICKHQLLHNFSFRRCWKTAEVSLLCVLRNIYASLVHTYCNTHTFPKKVTYYIFFWCIAGQTNWQIVHQTCIHSNGCKSMFLKYLLKNILLCRLIISCQIDLIMLTENGCFLPSKLESYQSQEEREIISTGTRFSAIEPITTSKHFHLGGLSQGSFHQQWILWGFTINKVSLAWYAEASLYPHGASGLDRLQAWA